MNLHEILIKSENVQALLKNQMFLEKKKIEERESGNVFILSRNESQLLTRCDLIANRLKLTYLLLGKSVVGVGSGGVSGWLWWRAGGVRVGGCGDGRRGGWS